MDKFVGFIFFIGQAITAVITLWFGIFSLMAFFQGTSGEFWSGLVITTASAAATYWFEGRTWPFGLLLFAKKVKESK